MSSELVALNARPVILDANILVRAVLGRRVLPLLEAYSGRVSFLAPEIAFASARNYLPEILAGRGLPRETVSHLLTEVLERLPTLIAPIPHDIYADFESGARQRLAGRDEFDWPFVALSLKLRCPIWTEDRDFFGTGVPTWTTDRVEIYLASDR